MNVPVPKSAANPTATLDAAQQIAKLEAALRNSDEWIREAVARGGAGLPSATNTLRTNAEALAALNVRWNG